MDKLNGLLLHRLQGFQSGKGVPDEAEDASRQVHIIGAGRPLAPPAPIATVTRSGDYRLPLRRRSPGHLRDALSRHICAKTSRHR